MTCPGFPDEAAARAWRASVDKVLKGADFERVLVTRTHDDIAVAPLYPAAEAGEHPGPDGPRKSCAVMTRIEHRDIEEAHRQALTDFENGADGLVLSLAGAASARGFGLPATDAAALDHILESIDLDLLPLRLEAAPFAGQDAAKAFADVVASRRLDPAAVDMDFGLDPIGDTVRRGRAAEPWPVQAGALAATTADLRARGFTGPILRADGRPHHEAGASEAQELAAALATGVAYLRALDAAGMPVAAARHAVSFVLVVDADEFLSMAKLRALRRLWTRIEEACGLAPEPIRLQAETAWRMLTRRDPPTNLLRNTIGCAAAILGGADAVTVLPFTSALGLPDAFARRLARNTPLVLLAEAGLGRVADPAAGSGAIEALTDALCDKAWSLFQETERGGGLAAELASGVWQRRVAEIRARRADDLAQGRRSIVGTTVFADAAEATPDSAAGPLGFDAVASTRDAEPFEDGGRRS